MPDKLTDSEIVKALECCANYKHTKCKGCPLGEDCMNVSICGLALDLINRLKEENESLYKTINVMASGVGKINDKLPLIKVEAYKEFAEAIFELFPSDKPNTVISRVTVKHLLKELVGEDK